MTATEENLPPFNLDPVAVLKQARLMVKKMTDEALYLSDMARTNRNTAQEMIERAEQQEEDARAMLQVAIKLASNFDINFEIPETEEGPK